MQILVPRQYTKREVLQTMERHRPGGKPHGSHISDLVELKKAVVLCDLCRPRFDAKRNQYRALPKYRRVMGDCDACRTPGMGTLLLHEQQISIIEMEQNLQAARVRRDRLTGG